MNEQDQLKLCAARYVYKHNSRSKPTKFPTWEKWWEFKFNDDYATFIRAEMSKRGG